jgi:hypothetical protein
VEEVRSREAATVSTWTTIARGALAEVSVERVLYEEPGEPHFFVRVRVMNLGDHEIAVDLRRYHEVFYPNQWGASRNPHREEIDERRMMPEGPLDAAGAQAIREAYRGGGLTSVPPRSALEYYRDFNASGRNAVDEQSRGYPYLLVVIDGQLRVTDGTVAERIDAPSASAPREVTCPTPVRWERVPRGAIVLRDR